MKKIKTILAILPALLFSCAGDDVEKYIPPTPIAPSEPGEEVVYHKRAKEQFDLINQCYRINSGATEGLYNENYPKKDGDNSASFLWPYDGLVSGAAALHALGYDVNYADMVDQFEVYYRTLVELWVVMVLKPMVLPVVEHVFMMIILLWGLNW